MNEYEGGGKRWLKYGCFGCLGFVGVVALFVAAVIGTAMLRARSEQVADRVFTHDVGITEAEATGTVGEPVVAGGTPGQVVLDLQAAEFHVEPGQPGEPLRVEATYDEKAYRLEESFETGDGAGWTYRVSFRRTSSSWVTSLKELLSGSKPRVRILLPRDVPMQLELDVSKGGSVVELGGLWLTSAELGFEMGGLELDIDEPLREPMERLTIRGSMGGGSMSRLGNASPRRLDVDFSMGGMELDLRGNWIRDAEISIDSSMAGGVVRLPRNVVIQGLDRGRVDARPEPEVELPTLVFSVSSRQGELQFID